MNRTWRSRLLVLGTAAATTLAVATPVLAAPGATFNIRDYGAKGDGKAIDSPAIDKAISAASAAGGGVVEVPAGTYLSRSIHLKSDITVNLAAGSKIIAAGSGMDKPEPNEFDDYQDFGHSHFRNALIWGEHVSNVHFTGAGTIDGDNKLETSNTPASGVADKAISLKFCQNVTFTGITMRQGGHFAVLANGCDGMRFSRVKILTSEDRDGINIINSSNVEVADSLVEASDDAVVFKSDYALGRTFVSRHNVVRDSTIKSTENNALQFGSETCGDFRDHRFSNLKITGAGKAGLGIVSMDGSVIEDVHYDNITLTRTTAPIFLHVGKRSRCPGKPPAGKIRNITFTGISGTNLTSPTTVPGGPEHTSTITGRTDSAIENVSFTNVRLTVPGNHPASDANRVPPENSTEYPPRIFGVRPSFGFWIRHAKDISFTGSTFEFDKNDGRPAFLANDTSGVVINGVRVERSTGLYDVTFQKSSGQSVTGSSTTSGAELRTRTQN
ncbi:glycosyl hydrolase family 28 protein [Crossiella sp. CA-258035]|uniref:glycoside hydrolase family 28 protein n=1 Tax=Crossiella sp. CA-258035 TaxID=2981138 RepID=UPI0024BCC18C|nr:glycosyl hydrolase family 28 protein [Crossiella sp. CA-258035]WHT18272.1 glycosyl hydrolase family 28 protein [Crossiella sp. CA-258035]